MASMRDIKRRRSSIQSTEQITKAMKLVSTVKLQKSRTRAENSKPYFDLMYETVSSMLSKSGNIDHRYLKAGASDRKAVIAITSNRGLAGGYNNNIIRMITGDDRFPSDRTVVFAIGNKGRDGLARKGYEIGGDYPEVIEDPEYRDAKEITDVLLEQFSRGEIGEIYLAYTVFKNTVSQTPEVIRLLPVEQETAPEEKPPVLLMNYEPEEESVLDQLVPKYISSMLYGALLEAVASENGARMTAMDSATSNAEEMIEELSLQYNRARQGSITQELTEIIAGANAIS